MTRDIQENIASPTDQLEALFLHTEYQHGLYGHTVSFHDNVLNSVGSESSVLTWLEWTNCGTRNCTILVSIQSNSAWKPPLVYHRHPGATSDVCSWKRHLIHLWRDMLCLRANCFTCMFTNLMLCLSIHIRLEWNVHTHLEQILREHLKTHVWRNQIVFRQIFFRLHGNVSSVCVSVHAESTLDTIAKVVLDGWEVYPTIQGHHLKYKKRGRVVESPKNTLNHSAQISSAWTSSLWVVMLKYPNWGACNLKWD